MRRPSAVLIALVSVALVACSASKPTLYPNDQYNKVGAARADQDIANCQAQAKEYVKTGGSSADGGQMAGEAARNAEGLAEAWFDPAAPVRVDFRTLDGEVATVEGVVPLSHQMVVDEREYRFSVVAGERSFLEITAQACAFPQQAAPEPTEPLGPGPSPHVVSPKPNPSHPGPGVTTTPTTGHSTAPSVVPEAPGNDRITVVLDDGNVVAIVDEDRVLVGAVNRKAKYCCWYQKRKEPTQFAKEMQRALTVTGGVAAFTGLIIVEGVVNGLADDDNCDPTKRYPDAGYTFPR